MMIFYMETWELIVLIGSIYGLGFMAAFILLSRNNKTSGSPFRDKA